MRSLQPPFSRRDAHNRFGGLVGAPTGSVEAETEGHFTIPLLYRHNSQLRLNYRCKPDGWISVELIHATPWIRPEVDGAPGFPTCQYRVRHFSIRV